MVGSDVVGPWCTIGEMVALSVTVPLKPFVPVTLMVKLAEEPFDTDRDEGLAVMIKSGVTTVKVTITE